MTVQGTFGSGGEVVFNVRVDTSQVAVDVKSLMSNFRKLELVALRYLALTRRMGLPEDVQAGIDAMARLIVIIRQAQMTYNLLQLNMGPVGWAMFVASGLLTAASVSDIAGSYT